MGAARSVLIAAKPLVALKKSETTISKTENLDKLRVHKIKMSASCRTIPQPKKGLFYILFLPQSKTFKVKAWKMKKDVSIEWS